MNIVKKHYEDFWELRNEEFGNYSRNLILEKLFTTKEKVLDLGCGDGVVGEYLTNKCNCDVYGIDISKEAIEKAKKRNIKAVVGNIEEKLPFENETFDTVFWGDNIEHLFDPLSTAKKIKKILKKDGRLIISCPNMGYWRYRLYYLITGKLPDTEWTGHAPWQWSHIRFFNIGILKLFIKEAGFNKVTKILGVSERKIDKLLLPFSQSFFGMIIIMEVK